MWKKIINPKAKEECNCVNDSAFVNAYEVKKQIDEEKSAE